MNKYDATAPDFIPWWERAPPADFKWRLARYRRALRFCKGRAADLYPILLDFIQRLEKMNGEPQDESKRS